MRYPAAEKLEIIRLVEGSPLPVRHTLTKLGIPRATFYRWCDQYHQGGSDALADRVPRAERVWNRIPQAVRDSVIELALDEPALSPRELAARFTDTRSYFILKLKLPRFGGHQRCFCARCPFYGQDPSPLCAGVSALNGRAGTCRA